MPAGSHGSPQVPDAPMAFGFLDSRQMEAVMAPEGPLLVVAGAGTGKTSTLAARCARLIASGTDPGKILLCTFTLKAAQEMRTRILQWAGPATHALWAGTFHHVGHRLLRAHAVRLGLRPDFSILDAADAQDMLGVVLDELGMGPPFSARKCQAVFSLAVGGCRPLGMVAAESFPELASAVDALGRVHAAYQKRKRERNVVDFDDMLVSWMHLLGDGDAGVQLRAMFDHILVDEYQDANPLQTAIVHGMAREHRRVTAVGDDAQSIYSFRGARLDTMQQFLERFPEARVVKLERNHRSVQPILDLANASLALSSGVIPRTLVSGRPGRQPPVCVRCADAVQEARFIAQHAWSLHVQGGIPLREIAVLTRTHSQGLEIQLEFSRRGIPFRVQGGLRILEQAHFRDFIAFLRVFQNPADEVALLRVFGLLPGLGRSTARQVLETFARRPPAPGQARFQFLAREDLWAHLPRPRRQVLLDFGRWLEALDSRRMELPELLERILEKYMQVLHENDENFQAKKEELQQLVILGNRYADLQEMLSDLGFQSGPAAEAFAAREDLQEMAVLSTVHQAKGLEWRVVFIPSLCEGAFPLLHSRKDADALEEERRIFYVAVTRAKDELYLTLPLASAESGQSRVFRRPSRFLAELSPHLYETWEVESVS